jgi:hypothetical protein
VQCQGSEETASDRKALRQAIDALLGDRDALGRLYRLAERTAHLPTGSRLAFELVCDAVGDLLLGDTTCDAVQTLEPQLQAAVRRLAQQQLRGVRETRTIPLEAVPASALILETELDAPSELDAEEVAMRIREHARNDEAALQLLALYERGIVRRRHVLQATGMDGRRYYAAKQRLVGYAAAAMSGTSKGTAPERGPVAHD